MARDDTLIRLQLLGGPNHGWVDHLRLEEPWERLTVAYHPKCGRMHVQAVDVDRPLHSALYLLDRDAWAFDGHEHRVAWYRHEDLPAPEDWLARLALERDSGFAPAAR